VGARTRIVGKHVRITWLISTREHPTLGWLLLK
jgi:hypothetical protein